MKNRLRKYKSKSPQYNIHTTRHLENRQNQTCSIFGFFDEVYKKKEEKRNINKQNVYNEDKRKEAQIWMREVQFEVIRQNKPESSGISVRTEFKQSNMMRSTMYKSVETIVEKNKGLRVKTINKKIPISQKKLKIQRFDVL